MVETNDGMATSGVNVHERASMDGMEPIDISSLAGNRWTVTGRRRAERLEHLGQASIVAGDDDDSRCYPGLPCNKNDLNRLSDNVITINTIHTYHCIALWPIDRLQPSEM